MSDIALSASEGILLHLHSTSFRHFAGINIYAYASGPGTPLPVTGRRNFLVVEENLKQAALRKLLPYAGEAIPPPNTWQ